MKGDLRGELVEFFRPYNERLYDLLGWTLDGNRPSEDDD